LIIRIKFSVTSNSSCLESILNGGSFSTQAILSENWALFANYPELATAVSLAQKNAADHSDQLNIHAIRY